MSRFFIYISKLSPDFEMSMEEIHDYFPYLQKEDILIKENIRVCSLKTFLFEYLSKL